MSSRVSMELVLFFFFFSSRRRHTRLVSDWSSDVCSSDLYAASADSVRRLHIFDAQYPNLIFAPALADPRRPIYLSDALGIPGYIQAYWHAALQGVPLSNFVHLPVEDTPPTGAIVITTRDICASCNILAES